MEQIFRHSNNKFFLISSPRRKELTEEQMIQELMNGDETLSRAQARLDLKELKDLAIEKSKSVPESDFELKVALLDKYKPFENFFIVRLGNDDRNQLVYYRKSAQEIHLLCPLASFNVQVVDSHLIKTNREMVIKLRDEWIDIQKGMKNKRTQSYSSVLAEAWELADPKSRMPSLSFDGTPHPCVLAGTQAQGECVIDYVKKDVSFSNLSESLQNLLNRIEYHKYLCAIIWSSFSGNQLPYVVYIQGSGGTGKSVFMNFLSEIVSHSVGNYGTGDFINSSLVGKALILLPENNTVGLMQHRELKSITGGDSVKIEFKGETAYSAHVRGLFIISSNYHLECEGTDDERRRLRYFQVTKDPNMRQISAQAVVKEFSSSKNEFLNYCRQCFDELEIKGSFGLINEAPNHSEIFGNMVSAEREKLFNRFFNSYVLKNYDLVPDCKCPSEDIMEQFRKLPDIRENKTLPRKFKVWLSNNYKVEDQGAFLKGLKLKVQSDLDDAMPNVTKL